MTIDVVSFFVIKPYRIKIAILQILIFRAFWTRVYYGRGGQLENMQEEGKKTSI